LTFVGGEFGGPCTEDTYTGAGTGYAFCDDGKWAYTTTDPATDGYNEVTPSADASFDTAPAGDAGHDGSDLRDGPERDGEDQGDGQQR
jgi:hypothetical protein